ncbi:MAG: gliding motility-associated C-terminal domain-containing protein [Bacteroidetes bacterium]|nr:gliding motility-associated C-terminal domain-containing protein [Bacteroidota bacterium]
MRYFLLPLFLFVLQLPVVAQNLVPNPGFEDTIDVCKPYPWLSTFQQVKYWFGANGTPDYFSSSNQCTLQFMPYQNPFAGYQISRSGTAHAGIFTLWYPQCFMEYIGVRLNKQLKSDREYIVSFYVSLADESFYSVRKLGAFVGYDSISLPSLGCTLGVVPQVDVDPGQDTMNWKLISGNFIARGGEQFLYIGNFHDNAGTDKDTVNEHGFQWNQSYYFIDDVSLIEVQDSVGVSSVPAFPLAFSPNGDSRNDVFHCLGCTGLNSFHLKIVNRWGQLVFEANSADQGWDGTFRGMSQPVGVYYWIANYVAESNQLGQATGNVTLIR